VGIRSNNWQKKRVFPVLFAIPRTSGWISRWEEMLLDPEQKIARPRQLYLGAEKRDLA
jgi:citrate synthase